MKILVIFMMTITLNLSIARTHECENWKLKMIKNKNEMKLLIGEEIDLNKLFTKIPKNPKDDHNTINIKSYLNIKGYKLAFFMNKNKDVRISEDNFNGNMVHFENKELTIAGSLFNKKYLNVIDPEDMKILSKDMDHNKDYIKAIKNTSEFQLYYGMFSTKFSEINCKNLDNWYSMAYLMQNKSSVSLLKSDWFYIDNKNYKLIIAYTKSSNQIELHYFTKKDSINLLFIYKNPINESDFYDWLNVLQ